MRPLAKTFRRGTSALGLPNVRCTSDGVEQHACQESFVHSRLWLDTLRGIAGIYRRSISSDWSWSRREAKRVCSTAAPRRRHSASETARTIAALSAEFDKFPADGNPARQRQFYSRQCGSATVAAATCKRLATVQRRDVG